MRTGPGTEGGPWALRRGAHGRERGPQYRGQVWGRVIRNGGRSRPTYASRGGAQGLACSCSLNPHFLRLLE